VYRLQYFDETPTRKNFTLDTKRKEWLLAAGEAGKKKLLDYIKTGKIGKMPPSRCRNYNKCKTVLRWGDRSYNFDHKDNNPRNNSPRNCYLVCRNCHGKATKIDKRAVRDIFGGVAGYQTIKRRVSYKKPKSTATKKKSTKVKAKRITRKSKKSASIKRIRSRRPKK
jgi:hypothetical protein